MKKYLLFFLMSLLLFSCDHFPTHQDLTGSWIEMTNNPNKYHFTFVDQNIVYFTESGSTKTLNYKLDKEKGMIYLKHPTATNFGNNGFKIKLADETLSIWGLHSIMNEAPATESRFEKE